MGNRNYAQLLEGMCARWNVFTLGFKPLWRLEFGIQHPAEKSLAAVHITGSLSTTKTVGALSQFSLLRCP